MNTEACAFVCAICTVISAVFSIYSLRTGDMQIMPVVAAFSGVAVLVAGMVIAYRYAA